LRPTQIDAIRSPRSVDEKGPREKMEASENTDLRRGGGSPALHRADPDRVMQTLSSGGDPAGYARLSLMVSTIFDRLVAGDREPLSER
jgi:hypothetical protein